MKEYLVFTGSYSRVLTLGTGEVVPGTGKGITVLRFDPEAGRLTKLNEYPEQANPTYLALDKTNRYLYANHEVKEFRGLECGGVSSFEIDIQNGSLKYINSRITGGTDACNVAVNDANTYLMVANFMSGSTCVFPRNEDGSIGKPTCFLQHKGSSVDQHRQKGPHAHQIRFDNYNRHLLVPDLGMDRIVIYDIDWDRGYLIPSSADYPKVAPGSGPRHCVFNANGDRLYLINEMGNTIYVYSYDQETAKTKELQIVSTIPDGVNVWTTTAAIRLHPSGKFLYGSNRGHNTLATYRVDEQTGLLTLIGYQPSGGKIPRDFDIDSSGNFLIAGNQDSNNLVVFKIDQETGILHEVSRTEGINAVTGVLIGEFDL